MFPALRRARGVAVETASAPGVTQFVIIEGYEARRNALPARAGFTKFCPRPPKSCLTITIANTEPTIGTHQGADAGMFIARRRPVTTALRSEIVTFCFVPFW